LGNWQSLQVTDITWKVVIAEIISNNVFELKLNTSSLAAGTYAVNLIIDEEIFSTKTIIKK